MQNKRSCDHLGKHNMPDQAGNFRDWQQCHQPRQRLPEEEEKVWDQLDQWPPTFWHPGLVSWKPIFPQTGGQWWGLGISGLGMIQVHYIYFALFLFFITLALPQIIRH